MIVAVYCTSCGDEIVPGTLAASGMERTPQGIDCGTCVMDRHVLTLPAANLREWVVRVLDAYVVRVVVPQPNEVFDKNEVLDEILTRIGPPPAPAPAPITVARTVDARVFPVLNQQYNVPREKRLMFPASVPWAFAETFRKQAQRNHSQTLERLAERGGLSPDEMWLAAHGQRFQDRAPSTEECLVWLQKVVREMP